MIIREIKKVEAEALKCLMLPLISKSRKITMDGVFGYDSEYKGTTVISVQLSCYDRNDRLQSDCFFVPKDVPFGSQFLYNCVLHMNRKYGLKPRGVYYLVAHFSQADISNLDDFDYVNLVENKATRLLEVSGTYIGEMKPNSKVCIKIYDTFAYFKMGLAKIGDILGFPKLKVGETDEQEQFYKENMDRLLKDNRELYIRYANRDAEITLTAYRKLLETTRQYSVDIKRYPTASSLALAVFRSNFLQTPVEPYKEVMFYQNEKEKIRYYYAGNKRIRYLALKSYWGGRNEAYRYGIIKYPSPKAKVYDVVSLYPSASRLQPLPNAETKWEKLNDRSDWQDYEGFLTVEFEFADDDNYPCLPVHDGDYLIFCTKGISHCTISEARQAVAQGATFNIVSGYGFIPTDNEINHDLKEYMKYWMHFKSTIDKKKDPFMYEFSKLMMNALIGKFVQRKKVTDMIQVSQDFGLPIPELLNLKSAKLDSIMANNTNIVLGSGFSPEWASLILGKARALISDIIYANKPLMTITDSILIDRPLKQSPALKELKTVNSGLECETPDGIDTAYIMRLRCYFLYNNQQLVKHAVGGIGVNKKDDDFISEVAHFVFNDIPLPVEVERKSLTKFRESYIKGQKWNSEIIRPYKPIYAPDRKRQMLDFGHTLPIAENWGNFETIKIAKIIRKTQERQKLISIEKEKFLKDLKSKCCLLKDAEDKYQARTQNSTEKVCSIQR